jgi:putative tryptophan/tyrosine transport system substrate-binding protein
MIRRREFIAGLGAAAWPLAGSAQQTAVPVIGVLSSGIVEDWNWVREGLKELGYVEGKNVAIEIREAPNMQFAPMLAKDLVDRQVAVIIAAGGDAVRAAKSATSTIPIVSVGSGFDLVKYGFAASLNRPGGNITGITTLSEQLMGKQVGLLHELLPRATTFGYLAGRFGDPVSDDLKNDVLSAAGKMGLEAFVVIGHSEPTLEVAFATLVERQASALVVGAYYWGTESTIVALAAQHSVPAIYPGSEYVRVGGLMSYGSRLDGASHQVAVQYIGPIRKGAKPADMPIQQPTKFEFVINLKTAKALGLTIPPNLLALADEVIDE